MQRSRNDLRLTLALATIWPQSPVDLVRHLRVGESFTMSISSLSFLKQRYLSERREFYLEKDRIRVYYKDSNGDAEIFVRYEDLTPDMSRISQRDGRLYNIAISFGLFALAGFVANLLGYQQLMRWAPLWAIAAVIFFGFYLWRRRNYLRLGLASGNYLYFLKNDPSEEQLLAFFKEMQEARKRYLRREYFRIIDPEDTQRELNRFELLLKEGIISKPEMEDMKAELQSYDGNATATN